MDWDYHFDRLRKGVEFLFGPFPDDGDWELNFRNRLEARLGIENGDKVLRLCVYLDQHERGLRISHPVTVGELRLHLLVSTLDPSESKSVNLRTTAALPRPLWWPSFLKAGNYLETILAQKMVLQTGDDDLLFLSHTDTVLETSIANIFIVRHNKLYTPPLSANVLDGVMRKKIINSAHEFFSECQESGSSLEQTLKADLVFCCNSVKGLFLVNQIDGHDIQAIPAAMEKFSALKKRVSR